MDLRETFELLKQYTLPLVRFRWAMLGVAWVVAILGWIFVYTMPNQYGADARVFLDSETVLKPLLRGLTVESDVASDVIKISQALKSRPRLEALAREADLDVTAKDARAYESLIEGLNEDIQISRSGQDVYEIRFRHQNRETALNVVKILVNSFVEDTIGSGQADSNKAQKALLDELNDYERRMTEAEDRLRIFKQANIGLMPDERGDYYVRLREAEMRVSETRKKLRDAYRRRSAIEDRLTGQNPVLNKAGNAATPYDDDISRLQQRRASLLVTYTEKHPEVVQVTQQLASLVKDRDEMLAGGPPIIDGDPATAVLDLNPIYQNLKIQLNDAAIEAAQLEGELAGNEESATELRKLVTVIPEVEAELVKLDRDYAVVKQRYEEVLVRWENLQTSKRVSAGAESVKFQIIDPPFAAIEPISPPRSLFILASLVVAIGLSVGLTFIWSMMKPVVSTVYQLESYGLPVLESVHHCTTSGQWRTKLFPAALCLGALVVAGFVLAATANVTTPLLQDALGQIVST